MGWLALIAAWALTTEAQMQAPSEKPVEVMVLGTWHFDNPGQDLINVPADDVLVPKRQAELEALAAALAKFKPTKIMVERVAATASLEDPNFTSFSPALLKEKRDERVQIGYRLAHSLGHPRVYAIDEQPTDGEPDYFPFGKLVEYDAAKGKGDLMQRVKQRGAAMTMEFSEKQARMSLPAMLSEMNAP